MGQPTGDFGQEGVRPRTGEVVSGDLLLAVGGPDGSERSAYCIISIRQPSTSSSIRSPSEASAKCESSSPTGASYPASRAARPAAIRAVCTRNGEQDT